MIKNDCDIEYFKFIRQEILDRIGIHYKTLVTKFIIVGGLFAFSLANSEKVGLSPFILSSIFAFLFDILLLENLGWIRNAGKYVKDKIEDETFAIRWENDFALYGDKWQCFNPWAYLAGVWSIGAFLLIGFGVSAWTETNTSNWMVDGLFFVIDIATAVYTVYLTFRKLGGGTGAEEKKM